jgi:predicted MPP superfamily phosphohydrolase
MKAEPASKLAQVGYTKPLMTGPKNAGAESRRRQSSGRVTWRRISIFIGLFGVILLLTNAFVCATLAHFVGLPHWIAWQAAPAAVALSFVAATLLGRDHSGLFLRTFYAISAAWLGVLNYAFFAALACWLADGIGVLAALPVGQRAIAAFCFGVGLLTALWGLVNAAWIRVTRVTVALPNLPEAWKHRSVALISDLHLGHVSGPFFLRRIIARLRGINPALVLVSGDMFDGTTAGLDALVEPWSGYAPPLGIYFVTGNHDEFAERGIYLDALAGTSVRVLNNERIVLDGLQLLGVHDAEAGDPESLRAILQHMKIDRTAPSILLAHQPSHLQIAAAEGVSLQLSGHTHRGQLWPWTLLVSRLYRQFAYGLSRLGGLQVYTSSGVGTWGPPLRVGTRSEIVVIRLVEEGDSAAPVQE